MMIINKWIDTLIVIPMLTISLESDSKVNLEKYIYNKQ